MCNMFDQKNVAPLKQYQLELQHSNFEGIICFLEIELKWWKIFNTTHAYKGLKHNNSYCHPIIYADRESILFLRQFLIWVEKWNNVYNEYNLRRRREYRKNKWQTHI